MLTTAPFLTPADEAQLGALEVASVRMLDGYMPGQHRSRLRGGCAEFSEHRAYGIGDDVRRLDWRVLAKSGRYFVKQFDEESRMTAVLVVDASGSMAFGEVGPRNYDLARSGGAGLARLLLGQRDAVGLQLVAEQALPFIPPRSAGAHFGVLLDALARTEPAGSGALAERLTDLCGRVRRRGLFVILTDGFCELAPLEKALRALCAQGHQVLLVQTLAREEVEFNFDEGVRFVDLEDEDEVLGVDVPSYREEYLERLARHTDELRALCAAVRGDFLRLRTDEDFAPLLAGYLRERAARMKTYT